MSDVHRQKYQELHRKYTDLHKIYKRITQLFRDNNYTRFTRLPWVDKWINQKIRVLTESIEVWEKK